MAIVSDEGNVYETEIEATAARLGLIDPSGWTRDKNEVHPNTMQQNKEMDKIETDPSTGLGLEVNWNQMNKPTGFVGMTDVGDSPVSRQVEDFKKQATGTVKPLKDISDAEMQTAINIAMGAGPGAIAGVRAATLPKAAFELAVDAERQGFTAQEIFKSTGFFKGADNKWRFEIDDSSAKYFPENLKGGQKLLSDVLSHKELFDAYPELRHVKVRVDPSLGNGASYTEANKLLLLGPGAVKDKSILVHEIQHAIQGVEGANKGGTPGRSGRDYQLKYEQDVNALRPEFLKLQNKEGLSEKEQSRLEYLREVFLKYVEYSRAGDTHARRNYEALAGEVEARNAQHRVDLTPSQRMEINPIDSEDIRRAEQLVRDQPSLTTPYVVKHPYDNKPDFHTY